jgi:flagellar biosynthesis/type III secretory pathway chaperone
MTTLSTTQLAELVRRKHAVLVQLSDLGRRQREMVERGETAALLKLLATKQTMISTLQQIERETAPYYAEDPDARAWPTADARADCARQSAECNRLLEEIVELERGSADRMTIRRNEVASQLQQVYAAGQARDAYEAQR